MDGARTVRNLLYTNWNSQNVGETPEISLIYDWKRVDLGQDKSAILLYQVHTSEEINSLYGQTKEVRERFTIDIRTTVSRDRLISLEKEVRRILEGFGRRLYDATNPNFQWDFVQPLSSVDRSDKSIKLYRYTMDCEVVAFATQRVGW